MYDVWITGGGKQTFVKSPQIENPQILGLIPLSQIRQFHRYASLQIANPQILMINPQISTKYCATQKLSYTSSFWNYFFILYYELEHYMLYL
jgi:hypothetical protein